MAAMAAPGDEILFVAGFKPAPIGWKFHGKTPANSLP
jgi:hypothetical protein